MEQGEELSTLQGVPVSRTGGDLIMSRESHDGRSKERGGVSEFSKEDQWKYL